MAATNRIMPFRHRKLLAIRRDGFFHVEDAIFKIARRFEHLLPCRVSVNTVIHAMQRFIVFTTAKMIVESDHFRAVTDGFTNICRPIASLSIQIAFLPGIVFAVAPYN